MINSFVRYLFKYIWFFVLKLKWKNKQRTSNLNSNVQVFSKSKNHLVWCAMSQLHKNENQNFVSNFVFQFTKEWSGTLSTRILKACNFIKERLQHSRSSVKFPKFFQNTFCYRTPPVAVSDTRKIFLGFGYHKFYLKTENNIE